MHLIAAHPVFALGLPHGSDWLIIFLLFPLAFLFWIAALVSCIRNESSSDNTKVVWVLVILFLHFFGALAYFLIRRPQRIRELGH